MNHNQEIPKVDDQPIPLWIKVMWFFGVLWIIVYIFQGVLNTPYTW